MRLTPVFAAPLFALAALLAACTPAAENPAGEPATATADQDPVMPADAPPQEEAIAPTEASSTSCALDQGADAAQALVNRCIAVSPATHPPCNVANPCQMIQDEIDRSCGMYQPGETRPAECAG
ncbi:MAG: hypothetical protein V4707_02815 [Pseudomonadota bacterium]